MSRDPQRTTVHHAFDRLSAQESPPTAEQIDLLMESSLEPHIKDLSAHIVGYSEAGHIRRHLLELQQSNLPPSILSQVFDSQILEYLTKYKHYRPSEKKLAASRAKAEDLQQECDRIDHELFHAQKQAESLQRVYMLQKRVGAISETMNALLERYTDQASNRRLAKSDDLEDMTIQVTDVVEALQEEQPHLGIMDMQQAYPSWTALLAATSSMFGSLPQIETNLYQQLSKEIPQTIAALHTLILSLDPSKTPPISDERFGTAEKLGGCPSRQHIMRLAREKARSQIIRQLEEVLPSQRETTVEDRISEAEKAHTRTKKELEIVKRLKYETKHLVSEVPKEAEALKTLQVELQGTKEASPGLISALVQEVKGARAHAREEGRFAERACEVLTLPPGSGHDEVIGAVEALLKANGRTLASKDCTSTTS